MDIKNLKKDQLLRLREDIDLQLKSLNEIKQEVKNQGKHCLLNLKENDKIVYTDDKILFSMDLEYGIKSRFF